MVDRRHGSLGIRLLETWSSFDALPEECLTGNDRTQSASRQAPLRLFATDRFLCHVRSANSSNEVVDS
jgi:hypothetical protein